MQFIQNMILLLSHSTYTYVNSSITYSDDFSCVINISYFLLMLFTPLCASTNSSKLKIAIILNFIRIFTVARTITVTTFETQKNSAQNYTLHSTLPRNHAHVTTSTETLLTNHCRQNHTTSRIVLLGMSIDFFANWLDAVLLNSLITIHPLNRFISADSLVQ